MARVEINREGLRQLRYSRPVAAMLEGIGRRMTAAANATLNERKGYYMVSRPGRRSPSGRWQVQVMAGSPHARYSDRKHNTLVRVLGSVR